MDHLLRLPNELLRAVLKRLPPHEVCRLRQLSRRYADALKGGAGIMDVAFARSNLEELCLPDAFHHSAPQLRSLNWTILDKVYVVALLTANAFGFPVLRLVMPEFLSIETPLALPRPHPDPADLLREALRAAVNHYAFKPASDGFLALLWVATTDDAHLFKRLLARCETDGTHPTGEVLTRALHLASRFGSASVVDRLLEPRLESLVDVAADDNQALKKASEFGHANVVRRLLEEGRSRGLNVDAAAESVYALRSASRNGHADVVRELLQTGCADPAACGNLPIRIAANEGCVEVVRLLLADGRADPGADDNGAIRWASLWGFLDVVKALLDSGRVDPSCGGNFALKKAAEFGHVEVVRCLMAYGRGVDASADNHYAVRMAVKNGHLDCVRCMLGMEGEFKAQGHAISWNDGIVASREGDGVEKAVGGERGHGNCVTIKSTFNDGRHEFMVMNLITGHVVMREEGS
ncbi:hypothetical protein HK101_005614 [Irineochytrium annulatum]|nr:hypothetical protein HK101_005614 [Irineochytrium annulatum]